VIGETTGANAKGPASTDVLRLGLFHLPRSGQFIVLSAAERLTDMERDYPAIP
jgi:hypothetical protein